MKSSYCDFCGAKIEPDYKFCIECGEEIKKIKKSIFKCAYCGKPKEKITNTLCNTCYRHIETDTRLRLDYIERLSRDIAKGYKRLEPYLSRYRLIATAYLEIYKYAELLPEEIIINPPTMGEMLKDMDREIKRLLDERINENLHYIEELGDLTYIAKLKTLKDEIKTLKEEYTEFEKILDTQRIDNIIAVYDPSK